MIKPRLHLASYETYSKHFGVPASTLRMWRRIDGWHPYGTERDRRWSMVEVQASYDLRRSVSACA